MAKKKATPNGGQSKNQNQAGAKKDPKQPAQKTTAANLRVSKADQEAGVATAKIHKAAKALGMAPKWRSMSRAQKAKFRRNCQLVADQLKKLPAVKNE